MIVEGEPLTSSRKGHIVCLDFDIQKWLSAQFSETIETYCIYIVQSVKVTLWSCLSNAFLFLKTEDMFLTEPHSELEWQMLGDCDCMSNMEGIPIYGKTKKNFSYG